MLKKLYSTLKSFDLLAITLTAYISVLLADSNPVAATFFLVSSGLFVAGGVIKAKRVAE
ncbi:MAG: hypothetical protein Q4C71_05725 [Microbacteriaceae bacterium]|nr:hypothetical protein [Microbacteriaceae bacterium]